MQSRLGALRSLLLSLPAAHAYGITAVQPLRWASETLGKSLLYEEPVLNVDLEIRESRGKGQVSLPVPIVHGLTCCVTCLMHVEVLLHVLLTPVSGGVGVSACVAPLLVLID